MNAESPIRATLEPTPERRKRGRPKLAEGKAKLRAVGFRTTTDRYERLVAAAIDSGRSIATEIEVRLDNSFEWHEKWDKDIKAQLNRIEKIVAGREWGEFLGKFPGKPIFAIKETPEGLDLIQPKRGE